MYAHLKSYLLIYTVCKKKKKQKRYLNQHLPGKELESVVGKLGIFSWARVAAPSNNKHTQSSIFKRT